jgi:hypothetical protein
VRLLPGTGSNLGAATERSLTLLRIFLVASALIIAIGGVVLSSILTKALSDQALADSRASVTQYVDGVLRDGLVRDGKLQVGPHVSSRLKGELRRDRSLVTVKVWRPDGVLAWTNRAQNRIGHKFELDGDLAEAIDGRRTAGHVDQLSADEDRVERSLGFDHLLEVYTPVFSDNGRSVLGAYEIYADPTDLEQTLASRRHLIWATVAAVLLALWAALALLVRGASSTLRRQTRQLRERSRALMDSYQRLEESSLEAIESLNATVEAKDPDTAGHSLRVQRVALALGEHLGLTPQQLDAALRLPLPRHREDRRPRRHPRQARQARPLGIRADEEALGRGSTDRRQVRPPARVRADHPAPPRALGRRRVSRRSRRRRDPTRGRDRRPRRRLGRDDDRSAPTTGR